MGQASKRGTFEQRQQAAYDRIDELTTKRAEHLAQLEAIEAESQAKLQAEVKQLVSQFVAAKEKQRLRRMGIRIGGYDGSAS